MAEQIIVTVNVEGDLVDGQGQVFTNISDGADKAAKSTKGLTNEVVTNGGAMAILNTLTSGYAQIAKDSLEATNLFSGGLKIARIQAVLFGTAVRAAMTATGIGLIVVAVSLLVEYWDDITDFVGLTNTALEEQARLSQEVADNSQTILNNYEALQSVITGTGQVSQLQFLEEQLTKVTENSLNQRTALKAKYELIKAKLSIRRSEEETKFLKDYAQQNTQIIIDEAVKSKAIRDQIDAEEKRISDNRTARIEKRKKERTTEQQDEFEANQQDIADGEAEFERLVAENDAKIAENKRYYDELGNEIDAFQEKTEENFQEDIARRAKLKAEAEAFAEAEKAGQQQILQAASQTFAGLASLAGENQEARKAFAIGQILTDAAVASIGIWRGWAQLGPWGIAGAAAQTAALAVSTIAAIAQVSNSTQATSPNIGSGGTSAGTGGEGLLGDTGPPQFAANGTDTTSQLGDTITGALSNGAIKTYVTLRDINGARDLERNTYQSATI